MRQSLIKFIGVTWEICGGREPSEGVMNALVDALEKYSPNAVNKALLRCQTECRGSISLADIISRIDDGRPGAEEAWAMLPQIESHSVVWTAEMAGAYAAVKDIWDQPVAARMAFKETYQRICAESKAKNLVVLWMFSPGTDENLQQRALIEAVEKNRITPARAMELAPHLMEKPLRARGLLPAEDAPQLPPPKEHKQLPGNICPETGVEWVSPEEIREFADGFARRLALKEHSDSEKMPGRAKGTK